MTPITKETCSLLLNTETDINFGSVKVCFGTKLYRQIVGFLIGTYCAALIVDLFLFCYERHFMAPLSDEKEAEIIQANEILTA